jgi:collagenase-like PrtC family protease
MKLALGPVQYYWPRDTVRDFYEEIARTPVDIVYLGEVICSRRRELRLADWIEIAQRLRAAGKEVILSTQVLLESVSDVSAMQRIVGNGDFGIEANDIGAVRCVSAAKLPFVGGPHLNLYKPDALEWIAEAGATRWVAPIEMGQAGLAAMQQTRRHGLETEVFAFGRLPLAYSARCFTARHHDLPKDECAFRCIEDPEGLMLRTREGEAFLVLNGIQTQSARVHSVLGEYAQAAALGVDVLRLSPLPRVMPRVIDLFDAVRHGRMDAPAAQASLQENLPTQECNGYWHGRPGLEQVEPA